ncbi:hypothetical protein CKJ65_16475 [Mycobacterium intracellulare]|nr:hypothetical protein CKJ65_16475 [Mycobacterium intracellulare]
MGDGEAGVTLPQAQLTSAWTEALVTESALLKGHTTWIIRCNQGRDHAQDLQLQIRDERLANIVDRLHVINRHEIPLSALIRRNHQL